MLYRCTISSYKRDCMTKKITVIDSIAMLKHKYSNLEIHLKNKNFYESPLNIFQILVYRFLGFDYIYGPEYVKLITERMKA